MENKRGYEGEENQDQVTSYKKRKADNTSENTKKICYKDFFSYEKKDNEQIGVCFECKEVRKIHCEIKMKNRNTSGLKSHLKTYHRVVYDQFFETGTDKKRIFPQNQKNLQTMFLSDRNVEVNQDRNTVVWLACKRLPANFFDDEITQNYFKQLCNRAMPKKDAMKTHIINEFGVMEQNLKNILKNNGSKFSFALDAWFARNKKSYYGMSIHFIDEDWIYRSLALDLVPSEGKHCGKDIANIFLGSLIKYGLEKKVQGITLDNAAANTTFMNELEKLLLMNDIEFDAKDQHFRCFPHILNLGAQDIFKLMNADVDDNDNNDNDIYDDLTAQFDEESIDFDENIEEIDEDDKKLLSNVVKKIRNISNKIRNSEQLTNKLKLFCELQKVKYLIMIKDCKTRWNSTYDMLNRAFNLRPALEMMFLNCDEIKKFALRPTEWDYLLQIMNFLKHFKYVSNLLSAEKIPTLPTVVVAFNLLIDKIQSTIIALDTKFDRNSHDEKLLEAFQKGRDKILHHYRKCNWVYCVSLILDPRFKLEGFNLTEWGKELKQPSIKKFEEIFKQYHGRDWKKNNVEIEEVSRAEDDCIDLDFIYSQPKNDTKNWRHEFDLYYDSARAPKDTDILIWWKNNSSIYPTISKMARDILSTLGSSVSVERLFSQCGLIMNFLRASMHGETLKMQMCINSWAKSSLKKEICEVNL